LDIGTIFYVMLYTAASIIKSRAWYWATAYLFWKFNGFYMRLYQRKE